MKNTTLLLVLALQLLAFNGFTQQTTTVSLMHGGIQRSYIIYVPANYSGNQAVPLLFNFHGYTSNANEQMWYGDFRPIADTAGFIIVHPEGTQDNTGTTHFNVGWGQSTVNDVSFTSFLIDTISAQYNINLDRVYSTGMSNGGFMSFRLACELSDRIAAIGSVTGSILPGTLSSCNPSHPMPILQIHGTSDQTVPYGGGAGWSSPINTLVNWWATENNCTSPATITQMPNISTSDNTTVEKQVYPDGDACTEVVHYKVAGGSHTWPGSLFNSPGTNYDIDASLVVWKFVSQFDMNGRIDCGVTSISELNTSPKELVKIVDLLGRETAFQPNTPLIYVYNNGSTERVIRMEE